MTEYSGNNAQIWKKIASSTWESKLTSYHPNPEATISDLRNQVEDWKRQALIDELTELPNTRSLNRYMEDESQFEEHRRGNREISIIFVDIDDFGQINKNYGDHNGDIALRTMADVFSKSIRKEDRIFRKGGDEFIIILDGAKVDDANKTVAEKLKARFADGVDITLIGLDGEEKIINVKASIGAFRYDPSKSIKTNVIEADVLMRLTKQQRKLEAARANQTPDPSP